MSISNQHIKPEDHLKEAGLELVEVTCNKEIEKITRMAEIVLHEIYDEAVTHDHIEFYLKNFQQFKHIEQEIRSGSRYFLLRKSDSEIGYLAVKQESTTFILDNFYLLSTYRGNDYGNLLIRFIESEARSSESKRIELIVHKENHRAKKFYHSHGFKCLDLVPTKFENGVIVENYRMEKALTA